MMCAQPDILVLGHRGFIGARLFRALRERHGDAAVRGLDLPETDLTQPQALRDIAWTPATRVLMTSGVKKQHGDNLALFRGNLAMAETVAQAFAERPVARLLFFSSADVYGEDVENTAIHEGTPVNPRSYYGIAKFASEGILTKAVEAGGGSVLSLRPPLIYGPQEAETFYGPTGFARRAKRGEAITLWGDGDELREFLFVDDIVRAATELLEGELCGILNPVAGRSYRFREILDLLRERFGLRFEVNSRPRSKAKVDNAFVPDRFRAACPGLTPTALEEGLRRVLEEEA